ncbi:hypothetical protein [Erythrobacter crassostreae]|uniref:Uncharacterized protein n=1 Tax=Erythrobacter crassostreae TaxID=2828328 RepID=A0A9X1F1X4_9SPHN|nr:hypothetical protein [Erythrobacter crassostrea]MBV7258013.1 hypothetical protein [Erythrobacter crassostrea]
MASTGVSAAACQGIQFETITTIASPSPQTDIGEGKVQLKIRVSEQQFKKNVENRAYIEADIVSGGSSKQVQIKLPMVTSCGSVSQPGVGVHYVVGQYTKEKIGDAKKLVFLPKYQTRKRQFLR